MVVVGPEGFMVDRVRVRKGKGKAKQSKSKKGRSIGEAEKGGE